MGGEYDCFSLRMDIVTDKEKLRALLTQMLVTQQELQEKVADLHADLESIKGDLRYLKEKQGIL